MTIYILIISIFNINFLYSKTPIKKKLLLGSLENCHNLKGEVGYNKYKDYYECINSELINLSQNDFKKVGVYLDLINLISIYTYYSESLEKGYIKNQEAIGITNQLIKLDYVKKFKKRKLNEIIKDISCEKGADFENFIKCFYKEFRKIDIYKSSTVLTKKDIEKLMFNSLQLIDDVPVFKKDKVIFKDKTYNMGKRSFIETKKGGFDYFYKTMDKVGEEYYSKYKLNDEQINKILMFIVISIVTAMIVEKLISVKAKGGSGSSQQVGYKSSSPGYASGTSTTTQAPFFKFHNTPNSYLFKYAPPNSVLRKPWFRYTVLRGGF